MYSTKGAPQFRETVKQLFMDPKALATWPKARSDSSDGSPSGPGFKAWVSGGKSGPEGVSSYTDVCTYMHIGVCICICIYLQIPLHAHTCFKYMRIYIHLYRDICRGVCIGYVLLQVYIHAAFKKICRCIRTQAPGDDIDGVTTRSMGTWSRSAGVHLQSGWADFARHRI